MKKIMLFLFVLSALSLFSQTCQEVWLQPPDPSGVDIQCTGTDIADDWSVAEDTYICAVHFWLSWQEDIVGEILFISVSINEDVPAGTGGIPYSHPGDNIWTEVFIVGDGITTIDPPEAGLQSFYNPLNDNFYPADHLNYYRVNCGNCETGQYISDLFTPFHAQAGVIYWLVVNIAVTPENCGWKTSPVDFMDDAVYFDNVTTAMWQPISIPAYDPSIHLAFSLCGCSDQTCPVELSSFDAAVTQSNFVQINWTTESESDLLGYNVLRNTTNNLNEAISINAEYINANNSASQSQYSYIDPEVECDCTYYYWLESVEMSGATQFHGPVSVTVIDETGEDTPDPAEIVTMFDSVYPNPFNPNTSFSYTLTKDGIVTFDVYNLKGQLVDTITHQGKKGSNTVGWNASDQASGVYMIHMKAAGFESMHKAVLIK